MVPSVRLLYPDGVSHFQQNHSSIHDSHVVQEWLLWQANVELTDWPPQVLDLNSIENTWSELKKTMQETWPNLPPRNIDVLWAFVSDALDEVAKSQCYV
jgi:hypothetical protein